MPEYYKPKTKKVNHCHYRKIILPRGYDNIVPILISSNFLTKSEGIFKLERIHPLIKYGLAYWVTNKQLCTGYMVGNVYQPIFNYTREEISFQVRQYIVTLGKIHTASARHHLYKQELMKLHNKKIPTELVEHIANYAWDIMLLL
tara:strand:+ start:358 stop:792 length:435 start_codon:yes stop_codon:yes gene_type:complete